MTYEELVEQAQSKSISMEKCRIFATLAVAQAIRDLHETMKARAAHAAECGYAVTGHPDDCSCDAAAEEPK